MVHESGDRFAQSAARNLSALISIATVSRPAVPDELSEPEQTRPVATAERDEDAFARFPQELAQRYPLLHQHLELQVVDGGGLLFRWAGSGTADPMVLMAHWDVVPVEADGWRTDPFDGAIDAAAGTVHGRGALDDKGSLVVICEAVESLLAEGVRPERDVYLSFGSDEEVMGIAAPAAVEVLRSRGVFPWLVLDEGGAVVDDAFPGMNGPVAMVGVAEKGQMDIELIAEAEPGHASTPRRDGAVARLARAVARLDENHFPARVTPPVHAMFSALAPHLSGPVGLLLRHTDRLSPAIAAALARLGPETAAVVRTTVALTQLQGSPARNVVAARASAVANVRILTGETTRSVLERIRSIIQDDSITLAVLNAQEPTPISPPTGPAFEAVADALARAYPQVPAVPYVMMQASDARHFHQISEHVYRFSPFRMTRAQRDSIHGVDEYVDIDSLGAGVVFYRALITGSTK
ncbi:M20/M25/M40 family metallo-hydrolase [Dermacoccaceae bacterium W4C1]